jgi:hypothetical protein
MLPNQETKNDQLHFEKYIKKMQKAHEVEIKWVKNQIVFESQKFIESKINKSLSLLERESFSLLKQFDDINKNIA